MQDLSLYIPSRVFCSAGSVRRLPEISGALGNRFLLITEETLSSSPAVKEIRDLVENSGGEVMVFNDIPAHGDSRHAEEAVELAKVSRLHGLIGFGGMRALGIARMTALAAGGVHPVHDILSGRASDSQRLPYIEIAGTLRNPFLLSDRFYMVDARNRQPVLLQGTGLYPSAAFIDYELCSALSDKFKIAVLIDILLHSVEGYLSSKNNFLSETGFLKAVALSLESIQARENGQGNNALRLASEASFFLAQSMVSASPGPGTAIAWSLGAFRSVPKSVVATVMLPHILEYGLRFAPEKVAKMGRILGENIKGLSVVSAADRTVERLRTSIGSHELPARLSELGLKKEDFSEIIHRVRELPFLVDAPNPLSQEDLLQLLEQAY